MSSEKIALGFGQRCLGQPASPAFAEEVSFILRDQVRMQHRMHAALRPADRTHHRDAFGDEPPQGERIVIRSPDLGQEARGMQLCEYRGIALSVFTRACAIAFTCIGLAITTRATNGLRSRTIAAVFPVASRTTSSSGRRSLPNATTVSCSSSSLKLLAVMPSSWIATWAKLRWTSIPIDLMLFSPNHF